VPSEIAAAAAKITQNGSGSPEATKPPVSRARKITPIVFWASWSPWPSAIAAADTVWRIRNPRPTRPGLDRRKPHMMASIIRKPALNAKSGDATIGMATFSTTVSQATVVPEATAAPTSPPISACDEDDGRPKYQVIRFQVMAPISPPITMTRPWLPDGGEITDPTVFATS
jgi:hypothetical protein